MTLIQIGKHLLVIRSIRLLVDVRVCIIYSWQPPFVCTLFRHPKVDPNIFFTSPHLLCEILSLWEDEEKNKLTKLCDEKNSSLTVPPVISIKPIQSDNFVRDYNEQDYLEEQTRMMMMMWWQKRRIFAGEFIKKVANLIKVFLYLSINSYLLPRKHTYSTRKQFVVVLVLFLGTRIGDSSTDEFAIEFPVVVSVLPKYSAALLLSDALPLLLFYYEGITVVIYSPNQTDKSYSYFA